MNKELHRHDISDSAWEKIKPHTIGEKGARGLNTKIHLAVDAHGMPVRFFITDATVADCLVA